MLYDGNNPILQITDVTQLRYNFGTFAVGPRKYAELLFLTGGNISIECAGNEYSVKTGNLLYLPQNLKYTASYTEAEIISIRFTTENTDSCPEVYVLHGARFFHTLFSSILAAWTQKEPGYRIHSISMLYRILCTIFNRHQVSPNLQKAVAFIHANYRDSYLTIGQICAHSGFSPTVLRQLFSTHYQQSPMEYIIRLRLLYARTLIADGVPIETAALESGFNDPKYFARVSKKYLQRTPSELKDFE